MYDDDFHRSDETPPYLYTVDTLDQNIALAMMPEEFEAEMRRLSARARRRSRRPAHRNALKAGAVRLAACLRGSDEPASVSWQEPYLGAACSPSLSMPANRKLRRPARYRA